MSQIQAAVCHSFDEPLRIETVDLRAPHGSEFLAHAMFTF